MGNSFKMDKELLRDILTYKVGKENAINSVEIQELFSCKGRYVRELVSELRREGVPICSGVDGYWIANDVTEVEGTIKNLRSRIKAMFALIISLEESLSRLEKGNREK